MNVRSKWLKYRPLAALLLALTGVGAPVATVVLMGGDAATEVIDSYAADEPAEPKQVQDAGN